MQKVYGMRRLNWQLSPVLTESDEQNTETSGDVRPVILVLVDFFMTIRRESLPEAVSLVHPACVFGKQSQVFFYKIKERLLFIVVVVVW